LIGGIWVRRLILVLTIALLGVDALFAGALVGGIGPSIWLQSIVIIVCVLAVMVRTVISSLQRLDPLLGEGSANLGATPFQTQRGVTFPLLMPAIMAGAVFTFVEGFDNLSVAIFIHSFRDRPPLVELLSPVQSTNTPLVAALSDVQIVLALIVRTGCRQHRAGRCKPVR